MADDLVIRDARFWLPLLALFHGARLKELRRPLRPLYHLRGGILNPELCARPEQPAEIASKLLDVLERRKPILDGDGLRLAQAEFLNHRKQDVRTLLFPY